MSIEASKLDARLDHGKAQNQSDLPKRNRRRLSGAITLAVVPVVLVVVWAAWLGIRADAIRNDMDTVTRLANQLKLDIAEQNVPDANATLVEMRERSAEAREAVANPLWTLAANLPWAGPNFSAVTEVVRAADDVVLHAIEPLMNVYQSLNWSSLLPSSSGTDLQPLKLAAPKISSAAYTLRASSDRLAQIDETRLISEVAEPLRSASDQLQHVSVALSAAGDVSNLAPAMLGADGPRDYLLVIQNNAEARASGGIPGALAVLKVDKGKLSLGDQASAGDVGVMSPILDVDSEQRSIYSERAGKFIQDVNLTPDFPTAANTAQLMWERKTGQRVHGVLSIDPVALAYVLDVIGPVRITNPELVALATAGLPTELSSKNVVKTLLSDVYAKIEEPSLQDAYFAGVAQEIFATLSDGKGDAKGLIEGLTRGTAEGRILVWSGIPIEQSVIAKYPVSGSVAGPSVAPAQFGVYFNDGTGAKMDYYVRRTVQLIKECPKDGYEQTTVRITSTNAAPSDAAISLPSYVTGAGNFGVPPGSVQTNIVAYGPVQAQVETAKLDGQKTEFAPYLHSGRPVGVLAIRLAPGESRTVDFSFGKIVQHTEPNVFVTPTVQDVKDVTLATATVACS